MNVRALRPALLATVSAVAFSGFAAAQANLDEVETITVTGYRASLEKALGMKRESVGVRDSIVAEDIGKYAATNIAESLQRVPGVALSRDTRTDEGKSVTVRGLDPSYTITTINGIPVHASTTTSIGSNNRGVDLDAFGADLFSRIDFYKSPQANLDEGGIGGVIDMRTPHPFDYDSMKVTYSAGYAMNSYRATPLPAATLQASNTWGPFGALFALTFKENDYQVMGSEQTGWSQSFNENGQQQNAILWDMGPANGGFDARGNTGSYTKANIEQAFVPRFARDHGEQNKRTRWSGLASFQFRPNAKWDVSVDLMGAHLTDDRNEETLGLTFRSTSTTSSGWAACQANPALMGSTGCAGMVLIAPKIDDNDLLYGTFGNSAWLSESRWFEGNTKFASGTLTAKYQATDDLLISFQTAMSTSNGFYSDNRIYTSLLNTITTYDPTKNYKFAGLQTNVDLTNPALYQAPNIDANYSKEGDRVISSKLAANYKLATGISFIDHVNAELGISYLSSQKTNDRRSGGALVKTTPFGKNNQTIATMTFAQMAVNHTPVDNMLEGFDIPARPTQWAVVPRSFYESIGVNAILKANPSTIQYSSVFSVTEAVESAYLMLATDGELFGRSLKLNAGVREAKTRMWGVNYGSRKDTAGNTVYFPVKLHSSYDDFLPSFSLAYDAMDDMVFRAAYGRTITRPGLGSIAGSTSVGNRFNAAASSGNMALKPMIANNVDLGVEWYFQPESVLSIGAFYKGVKNLISNSTEYLPFSSLGLPESVLECTVWCDTSGHIPGSLQMSLSHPVNLNPMAVRGFEVYYQQPFSFLPEPFDGLGALVNFTYTSGKQSGPGTGFVANNGTSYPMQIRGLSAYTYNATMYYEKDGANIRLSYNWRSKTPVDNGNYYQSNMRMWQQARGTLDATIGYDIFDNLEVRLDITNIMNSDEYQYIANAVPGSTKYGARFSGTGADSSRIQYDFWHGRNFTISLRGHL
jgi:TonB-dependent receptor